MQPELSRETYFQTCFNILFLLHRSKKETYENLMAFLRFPKTYYLLTKNPFFLKSLTYKLHIFFAHFPTMIALERI